MQYIRVAGGLSYESSPAAFMQLFSWKSYHMWEIVWLWRTQQKTLVPRALIGAGI